MHLFLTLALIFTALSHLNAAEKSSIAPGQLTSGQIDGLDDIAPERRKLVELALKLGREHPLDQYLFGSADPTKGGFDCSGSLFFILKQAGLKPARSSSAQFDWIKQSGSLVEVPPGTTSLDAPVFAKLQPGDLLFWSGTYKATDGRTNKITHVQMYLGKEKKDGRPVMIGSSDGRSYRGIARCGFGIFDFKLPSKTSKSRFAGFGPPPGLLKIAD